MERITDKARWVTSYATTAGIAALLCLGVVVGATLLLIYAVGALLIGVCLLPLALVDRIVRR